ncbi:MAG: RNA polymerase sigma factor [Candidatus Methylacidiphilales bacterium]
MKEPEEQNRVADGELFRSVVETYYQDLYRFALSLARNSEDASDLVQQTYSIFAQKGGQLRDPSKAKSWLFTTLYREFTTQYRRSKRTVALDETYDLADDNPGSSVVRQSERNEMMVALHEMEGDQRAILSLFYINQHSYKEIAELLNIPIGTVMSRLSRAKSALRELIVRTESPTSEVSSGIKPEPGNSNDKRDR